ncbi:MULTISPECIES: TCR/Tet family MFS transporter [Pacificibacter]|uniref:TCR/Tet family MFS transporter n=1 Tax=Pacificibacter TaxID=1042323 RepID=UPI001C091526|nr:MULTISPECIES: TCR/Tet family MFS transporter [Pacificibacter]MBU2934578.1 TCR/Tet family MFS transporter [Pacificibacter marinus]MDO6616978.1 TCR/Tet family MFS transporter [Pacificibacter sp. 1_MG-2023]
MRARLPIIFIVATILIDGIGAGLIFPVLPDLILEVTGKPLSEAAIWGGVLATGYAVMQFVCGPIVGNLSDRYGRKPILIAALFVLAIDYAIMAVAGSIWLLLLGRIIAGLMAATYSTASAFMADISKPEDREKNFGIIGAAVGIGFALGPVIGGFLAEVDTRAPFWVAGAMALANGIFGLLVMPESLPLDKRRPFSMKRANPLNSFKSVSELGGVRTLLVVFFLYQVALFVYPAIWAFYGREQFAFSARDIGLTLFVFGVSMGLSQALLVGPIVKRFGAYKTAVFGMTLELVIFVTFAVLTQIWLVWMLVALSGLGSIVMPALQGIMSRAANDDQQGELQGVLGSIAALATIVSPLVMTMVFAQFSRPDTNFYLPGAPFAVSAILIVACTVLMLNWRKTNR